MHIDLLHRPSQTLARTWLEPGESIVAESGALVGMTPNVSVETHGGGVLVGLKRLLGGETLFRNRFRAEGGRAEVLFAPPLPGDLEVLEIGARPWCLRSGSFVAATDGLDVRTRAAGTSGVLGGWGISIVETIGTGSMVISGFGALERIEIDGSYRIDSGHVVAWESSLLPRVGRSATGWLATLLSGEAFSCSFEGRGAVLVQSRNPDKFARSVGRRLPPREG
jgi:uncharacterized protein (TIGR00266 family)